MALIEFEALNEGFAAPNTAEFQVYDDLSFNCKRQMEYRHGIYCNNYREASKITCDL
jgi:hypothetical protein